ncbi:MAG TPA: hypothetical protein VFT89_08025 [Rhizobiaceae bacterium]|nr:hypothetical protein [Rhizobiaceae bacterium]
MAWKDRPKDLRYATVGAFIGMVAAAVVTVPLHIETDRPLYYALMAGGFLIGMLGGRLLGQRSQ